MRILCPACAATYDVPDSLVTPGRVVRCARCGGDWTPEAAAAPSDAEAPPLPPPAPPAPPARAEARGMRAEATAQPSAMDRLAAQQRAPRSSSRLLQAWAVSVALLLLAAGATVVWRGEIVAIWPQSALAYAAIGLHPATDSPH